MNNSRTNIIMFLIGLGSCTKVYLGGVIAFSELAMFAVAPFLLIKHYRELQRSGFLAAIWLPIIMIFGCLISCQCNGASRVAFVKSSVMFYSIFANIVVFYVVLRKDFKGIGMFFLGLFISSIIAIFAFDPRAMVDAGSTLYVGEQDVAEKTEDVLFLYPKINALLRLPIQGLYFKTPIAYSVGAPVIGAVVALLVSISGRASAAMSLLASTLILIGRKSRTSMRKLGRHFILFILIMFIAVYVVKSLYSYTARTGMLGEEARNKYEMQTQGDSSLIRMLVSGRTEFFIGIRALLDSPIVGLGPYPIDHKGYNYEFFKKYGTREDYERFLACVAYYGPSFAEHLREHSTIIQFWGRSGLPGLFFVVYFFYLLFVYFRKYSYAIPQWYGYFAISIPSTVFSLVFNPYHSRVEFPLLITCLLLVKAVGQGRLRLPYGMEMEAKKYE